jgi:hypothetical protein
LTIKGPPLILAVREITGGSDPGADPAVEDVQRRLSGRGEPLVRLARTSTRLAHQDDGVVDTGELIDVLGQRVERDVV